MADTELVIGQTPDGRTIVFFSTAGPSSYSTGGFDITITKLRRVEAILTLDNNYGFRTSPAEAQERISANKFTVPVHYYGYACPGAPACATGWEVEDGKDLSHVTFYGIVIGY